MNESKLKVGSKIKVTDKRVLQRISSVSPIPYFLSSNAVGYLTNKSMFQHGNLKDKDGDYWMTMKGVNDKICLGPATAFKVLKY
jgi:hypothetical protein